MIEDLFAKVSLFAMALLLGFQSSEWPPSLLELPQLCRNRTGYQLTGSEFHHFQAGRLRSM